MNPVNSVDKRLILARVLSNISGIISPEVMSVKLLQLENPSFETVYAVLNSCLNRNIISDVVTVTRSSAIHKLITKDIKLKKPELDVICRLATKLKTAISDPDMDAVISSLCINENPYEQLIIDSYEQLLKKPNSNIVVRQFPDFTTVQHGGRELHYAVKFSDMLVAEQIVYSNNNVVVTSYDADMSKSLVKYNIMVEACALINGIINPILLTKRMFILLSRLDTGMYNNQSAHEYILNELLTYNITQDMHQDITPVLEFLLKPLESITVMPNTKDAIIAKLYSEFGKTSVDMTMKTVKLDGARYTIHTLVDTVCDILFKTNIIYEDRKFDHKWLQDMISRPINSKLELKQHDILIAIRKRLIRRVLRSDVYFNDGDFII